MILARTLIFGFPLLFAAVVWWSAVESNRSHTRSKDGVVLMLPQSVPVLNPYLPTTEVERQIIDLVHEPLLRIGIDGSLQPALAEYWRWAQDVTCWFADEATAKRAQELLQSKIGEKNLWAEWHLSSARVIENSLLLSFDDTGSTGIRQALEVIAELAVQPAVFWRIERHTPLRQAWEKFIKESSQAKQIRRVWFDGANACEIVVVGSSQRLLDDLRHFLDADKNEPTEINALAEVGALVEPVLDLDIRPGQSWHDGTTVTAEDARATIDFLRSHDLPLANREALRQIQSLEVQNNNARLHVTFRRRYGPALCAWADLFLLPAAWLKTHPDAKESDFIEQSPPGAGTHRIAARDSRSLILVPVRAEKEARRFLFNFSASPLMTQIGMRTHTVDLVWPASAADHTHLDQLRFTPPHHRLVVLWNTRHDLLKNVRLREALAKATDTDDLIRTLPGRHGKVDASLFAPSLWYSSHAERTPFQLEEARQILADEGWPRDVQGVARNAVRVLEFKLLVPTADALHLQAANRLVDQWSRLGVQVSVERIADAQTLALKLREHRFDAVLLDQRFEISWDQLPWWHSSQAAPGGTNFSGITHPQIDLLLEALSTEFDPAHVPARVRELESKVLPLHPMLTLFTTHDEAAASSSLQNLTATDALSSSWTLRMLALPPKRVPSAPVIDLKLRTAE